MRKRKNTTPDWFYVVRWSMHACNFLFFEATFTLGLHYCDILLLRPYSTIHAKFYTTFMISIVHNLALKLPRDNLLLC
jgi:hypothetical protein